MKIDVSVTVEVMCWHVLATMEIQGALSHSQSTPCLPAFRRLALQVTVKVWTDNLSTCTASTVAWIHNALCQSTIWYLHKRMFKPVQFWHVKLCFAQSHQACLWRHSNIWDHQNRSGVQPWHIYQWHERTMNPVELFKTTTFFDPALSPTTSSSLTQVKSPWMQHFLCIFLTTYSFV